MKVAKGAGGYGNAGCTSPGGSGAYEWLPGVVQKALTIQSATPIALETVAATKIACASATGTGEYTGAKTLAGVTLTFSGCELSGQSCSNGLLAGEVTTDPLEGALGIEKLGATSRRDKIALHLFPAGAPAMEFDCGGLAVSVQGSVLVPVKVNRMFGAPTLDFKATKGKQKPEGFVEGARDVLEASLGGAADEQLGLTLKATLSNGEAVEVNSTV